MQANAEEGTLPCSTRKTIFLYNLVLFTFDILCNVYYDLSPQVSALIYIFY